MQILAAVNNVLSLDITEPLMKILSGVEYILKRAQVSHRWLSLTSVDLYRYPRVRTLHIHGLNINS